jgi:hypothetical protein
MSTLNVNSIQPLSSNLLTLTSASLVGLSNVSTAEALYYNTASGEVSYGPAGGGAAINTGSFYVSSSIVDATITFNQGDGSTESVTVNNVQIAETASYADNFTVNNITVTNLATVLSASISFLEVIYQTSSVIYSTGSNQFGDAADDTQTLYGSVIIPTGSLTITGSAYGNVSALSIVSNTASLDLSRGNFFTLTLASGSATRIQPSNIKSGQTINLLVTTLSGSLVTFPNTVKQPTGSAYTPSVSGSQDVLTFISFDASSLYMSNIKRLV